MVLSERFTSCRQNPAQIIKIYKSFAKELDFKDLRFPFNIIDMRYSENRWKKGTSIYISVFSY